MSQPISEALQDLACDALALACSANDEVTVRLYTP